MGVDDDLSTNTSYADLLNQLDNHVYMVDISQANSDEGYDLSGYVFEFFTLDVSDELQVNPLFDTTIQQTLGLDDCSAIATMDAPLSQFETLFSFQSDSSDVTDLSSEDIKFGVDISALNCFNDLVFSGSTIREGQINSHYDTQTLQYDYVRNIAKQITGGLSAADIFSNEEEMRSEIEDMDISLQDTLNYKINLVYEDTSNNGYLTTISMEDSEYEDIYKASQALYTINLHSGDSSTNYARTTGLFEDISSTAAETQTDSSNCGIITVPLRFHAGDIIAIRLVYKQADDTGGLSSNLSLNTITPRSYKLLIRLTE